MTTKKKDVSITFDKSTIKAQEKIKELQKLEYIDFYLWTENHQRHANDLTGKDGVEAWEEYKLLASDFMKKDIDGIKIVGFMSKADKLYKYETSTGMFSVLGKHNKVSTLFIPKFEECGLTPEQYWNV